MTDALNGRNKENGLFIPPRVHLLPAKGLRNSVEFRAHRISENLNSLNSGVQLIYDVLDFLDVENSLRYRPSGDDAFCNVYAYDFCCLCDVYIPRVWWLEPAKAVSSSPIIPGTTVRQLRANDSYDWLIEWGESYGWHVESCIPGETEEAILTIRKAIREAQAAGVGLIVGRRAERDKNGHISLMLPSAGQNTSTNEIYSDSTSAPIQSQAGVVNNKLFASRWFDNPNKFDAICFAFCPLSTGRDLDGGSIRSQ